jgi:branched-subunit amino acid aminotransferase/4-amino-4-deoxychorismate lyase
MSASSVVAERQRAAAIQLRGVRAVGRSLDELVEASQEGRLEEVFCTGTAAVVLPVASLIRQSGEHVHAHPFNPAPGEMLSTRLGAALADIQYGSGGASHHWQCPIDS